MTVELESFAARVRRPRVSACAIVACCTIETLEFKDHAQSSASTLLFTALLMSECRDGRDIIQGHIRHVSDAQGRHPDASTAPTWLWLLACRCLRYVTGRPSGSVDTTRMDLLECWVFITITHGGLSTLATSTEAYFHFAPGSGLQGETAPR